MTPTPTTTTTTTAHLPQEPDFSTLPEEERYKHLLSYHSCHEDRYYLNSLFLGFQTTTPPPSNESIYFAIHHHLHASLDKTPSAPQTETFPHTHAPF